MHKSLTFCNKTAIDIKSFHVISRESLMVISSRYTQRHFVLETNQNGTRDHQLSTVTKQMVIRVYRINSSQSCWSSATQSLEY